MSTDPSACEQEVRRDDRGRPEICAGRPSIAACHVIALLRLDPGQILRERTPQIDVAGERVDFLAVDEHLHARDRRQVHGERVDDRVDGEQLVERAAGMPVVTSRAQIDERVAALGDEQRRAASCRAESRRRAAGRRRELRLDDLARLLERRSRRTARRARPPTSGMPSSRHVEERRLDLAGGAGRRRAGAVPPRAVGPAGGAPATTNLAVSHQRRRDREDRERADDQRCAATSRAIRRRCAEPCRGGPCGPGPARLSRKRTMPSTSACTTERLEGVREELLLLLRVRQEAHLDEHRRHVRADEHAERRLLDRPRAQRHALAQRRLDAFASAADCSMWRACAISHGMTSMSRVPPPKTGSASRVACATRCACVAVARRG